MWGSIDLILNWPFPPWCSWWQTVILSSDNFPFPVDVGTRRQTVILSSVQYWKWGNYCLPPALAGNGQLRIQSIQSFSDFIVLLLSRQRVCKRGQNWSFDWINDVIKQHDKIQWPTPIGWNIIWPRSRKPADFDC